MLSVTPEHLGLPSNLTLNLNELYEGGVFKNDDELENLIKLNGSINYQIGENTRIAIRAGTKYILGEGTHHDGVLRPYGNTAPLLHKKTPEYSSSNISNLMGRIKKGSKKFRAILTRNQDFITSEMIKNWNKTLKATDVEVEEIRCAFKMFRMKEFTVQERDKILKLLTRKTLFNNQHKRIFPNNRPEWAMEDFCTVLSNLGIAPAQHPSKGPIYCAHE